MMDYTKLKVADLKALCGSRGLGFHSKGKKAELVGALVMYDANEADEEEAKKLSVGGGGSNPLDYKPGSKRTNSNNSNNSNNNNNNAHNAVPRLHPDLRLPPFIRSDPSIINIAVSNYLSKLPITLQNSALSDFQRDIDSRVSINSYQGYLIGIIKRFIRDGRGGPKALRDKVDDRDRPQTHAIPFAMRTMEGGLSEKTCRALDDLFGSGFCKRGAFDQRVFERLKECTENQAICSILELQTVSAEKKQDIRNFGGYLMGIVNNYKNGGRDHVIDPKTGERTGGQCAPEHNRANPYLQQQQRAPAPEPVRVKPTWEQQLSRIGGDQASPVLGSRPPPQPQPIQTLGLPPAEQQQQYLPPPQMQQMPHMPSQVFPPPTMLMSQPPPALNLDLSAIAAQAASAVAMLNTVSYPVPVPVPVPPPQQISPGRPTITIESFPLVVQYALTALESKTGEPRSEATRM
ncbi:hypothetical protein TL16_g02739 [Triparma laevis f. inornata]|uniref:SAP domain-containing protein n=1 Tax=Triparma laevis f. inornata TaxID=1714386 RepID=A0A9W7DY21_9STRA|nr:hypothetical protein TL16_g02739 [Triparma laevis f. inornata]